MACCTFEELLNTVRHYLKKKKLMENTCFGDVQNQKCDCSNSYLYSY